MAEQIKQTEEELLQKVEEAKEAVAPSVDEKEVIEPPKWVYEYFILIENTPDKMERKLNDLSQEGWFLEGSIQIIPNRIGNSYVATMSRWNSNLVPKDKENGDEGWES